MARYKSGRQRRLVPSVSYTFFSYKSTTALVPPLSFSFLAFIMSFLRRADNAETGFSTLHFEPAAHGEYVDASGTAHAFEVTEIVSSARLIDNGRGVPMGMRFAHEGFPLVSFADGNGAADAGRQGRGGTISVCP